MIDDHPHRADVDDVAAGIADAGRSLTKLLTHGSAPSRKLAAEKLISSLQFALRHATLIASREEATNPAPGDLHE